MCVFANTDLRPNLLEAMPITPFHFGPPTVLKGIAHVKCRLASVL